jgi:hypothetical protein
MALVGWAARRATTRANPHHLARLLLVLDMAHLGRADARRCRQSKPTFLCVVKGRPCTMSAKTGFANRGKSISGRSQRFSRNCFRNLAQAASECSQARLRIRGNRDLPSGW